MLSKTKRHSASDNKHLKWQTILSILFKHSKISKFEQNTNTECATITSFIKIKKFKWKKKNSKTNEVSNKCKTRSLWLDLELNHKVLTAQLNCLCEHTSLQNKSNTYINWTTKIFKIQRKFKESNFDSKKLTILQPSL